MALELRSEDTKEVEYAVINTEDKTCSFSAVYPGWLSSLVMVHSGKLFVQKYRAGNFPDPAGWIIINIKDSIIEAEEKDGALGFISENLLIHSNLGFENINYYTYNLTSGEKEKLVEKQYQNYNRGKRSENLPQQYLMESIHFNTVKEFIKIKVNKDAKEAVEYLETGSKIIVSYYIRAAEKLDNFLLVMDHEGNVLMDKLINSNMNTFKKDTFFLKENLLIFIKDKKELISYVL